LSINYNNETCGVDWMKKLKFGVGINYNNFKGVGCDVSISPAYKIATINGTPLNMDLGLSLGSDGVGITPSLNYENKLTKDNGSEGKLKSSIGLPYDSRAGLKQLNIGASYKGIVTRELRRSSKMLERNSNQSSSFSFVSNTYTPSIDMPMINSGISCNVKVGGEIFGTAGTIEGSAYYSMQALKKRKEEKSAYGYIYTQNVPDKDEALTDFNRENDGAFTKNKPYLPVTNFSYDIYSVSGQGIGSMFRPYRQEVGILNDAKKRNTGVQSGGISLEFGLGNIVKFGGNTSLIYSNSVTGEWKNGNDLKSSIKFKDNTASDPFYETCYFKNAGEKNADSDKDFFEKIGGFDPIRVKIIPYTPGTSADNRFVKENSSDPSATTIVNNSGYDYTRSNQYTRQRRNEMIVTKMANEACYHGLEIKIKNYPINTFAFNENEGYSAETEIGRTDNDVPGYHISEITTLRNDGARYVYGIPAYNNLQVEATFAIQGGVTYTDGATCSNNTGLVNYTPGVDDDPDQNSNGLDHYVSKVTTPKYAHSYLLTAVLSPDYSDLTGNGPTSDDLGNYTKFNYTKVSDYKWRVPFEQNKANYSEGLKSRKDDNRGDDKASYVYGEKDLWYVHSIETKTHVAEFYLSDRHDAYGVAGQSGGIGSVPLQKLDKIVLYSKEDRINHPYPEEATPIKTVHFVYSYDLCTNLPNNDGTYDAGQVNDYNVQSNNDGKLTLKKVYFTYGNSDRAGLNQYEFDYGQIRQYNQDHTVSSETVFNPTYTLKGYDRWGRFNESMFSMISGGPNVYSAEFPYTQQGKFTSGTYSEMYKADVFAVAWNLTEVSLPSGSVIRVDYEADEYAYVQDKKAMRNICVLGVSNEVDPPTALSAVDNLLFDGGEPAQYYLFELPEDYECSNQTEFVNDFFTDKGTRMKYIHFNFLVDIGNDEENYEYVSGYGIVDYATLPNYFTDAGTGKKYGWVKISSVDIQDDGDEGNTKVNPVSQTAWNFAKLHLPEIAYLQPEPGAFNFGAIMDMLAATFESLRQFIIGYNGTMKLLQKGKTFVIGKSWIRVNEPDMKKKGGGERVKKITISDEWSSMVGSSNGKDAIYGQTYNYNSGSISSGVAAYEPLVGGDENPLRQPIFYKENRILVPDEDSYMEEPIGESFYPGPSVGYSKVTVQNIAFQNVQNNGTGKTVNEFYTAKDFPVKVDKIMMDPVRKRPTPVMRLLKLNDRDMMTASAGYSIISNDMHGKPKAVYNYPYNSDSYNSYVKYSYRTNTGELDNMVQVVDKYNNITTEMVGVDYDMVVDMRDSKSETYSTKVAGNLDTFIAFLPITIPFIVPGFSYIQTRFKSAVVTKVIQQYGILQETEAYNNGSLVITRNELFDKETGEVVLTSVDNDFKEKIYNLNLPAYWAYQAMGPAYMRTGAFFSGVSVWDGIINNICSYGAFENKFMEGDELALYNSGGYVCQAWVWDDNTDPDYLFLIDRDGEKIANGEYYAKVVRAAERNLQSSPLATFVSKESPIGLTGLALTVDKKILNSSAIEYGDVSAAFCSCDLYENGRNPYVSGQKGNWKPLANYAYLTGRTQTVDGSGLTDIKRKDDGIFTAFSAFWTFGSTGLTKTPTNWQFVSTVSMYDPEGLAIESRDALGIYSGTQYGYNNNKQVAVAGNAKSSEIAFDGFEDYNFDCGTLDEDAHFKFVKEYNDDNSIISFSKSHTGRNSIKVVAGETVKMVKNIRN